MRVYLAGSARNLEMVREVQGALRAAGHEVYDWLTGPGAYTWEEVGVLDTDNCTVEQMREAARRPALMDGLAADAEAMEDADVFVLLLPAGADAHVEFGTAPVTRYVLALSPFRASQFYASSDGIFGSVEELLEELEVSEKDPAWRFYASSDAEEEPA